jgi:hypothetical protein
MPLQGDTLQKKQFSFFNEAISLIEILRSAGIEHNAFVQLLIEICDIVLRRYWKVESSSLILEDCNEQITARYLSR